jgi:hypothetical protein
MTRYFVCTACASRWQVTRDWQRKTHGTLAPVMPRGPATLAALAERPASLQSSSRILRRIAVIAGTAVAGSILARWRPVRAAVAALARDPGAARGTASRSGQEARTGDAAGALDLARLQDDGGAGDFPES